MVASSVGARRSVDELSRWRESPTVSVFRQHDIAGMVIKDSGSAQRMLDEQTNATEYF